MRSTLTFIAASLSAGALLAAGCTSAVSDAAPDAASDASPTSSSTIADDRFEPTKSGSEIDAEIAFGGLDDRDVEGSALPPRHLDTTTFPESLVDRTLIVSGGPPPDGIPAIDAPTFTEIDQIDWLEDDEAVLVLDLGNEIRVYPTQIMVWHEIVNDEVDGRPVTVTYCPLCNSGIAFDRSVRLPTGETTTLDFGTSGSLYQSAMVMYDRQTESLWTHFDGRAVIGAAIGAELDLLPLGVTSWADARDEHGGALVLERPGTDRDYGRNPYVGYDQSGYPIDAFFEGAVDPRLPPMTRVVGLEIGDDTLAITLDDIVREGVVTAEIGGEPVVLWHTPGLASSLEADTVAGGSDIGSVSAFVTDERFVRTAARVVDEATNSEWNVFGTAVSGPRAGERLSAATKIDTFWFAWSTYHPETALVG